MANTIDNFMNEILSKLCIDMHILKSNTVPNSGEHSFEVRVQCKLTEGESAEEKCDLWISKFSSMTNTNWITKRRFPKACRYEFRKLFACQHSDINKVKERKKLSCRERNKRCKAMIDFKFKKINRFTIRNDNILKDGRNVVIHITFNHTHKVNVADAFGYLRLTQNTKEIFHSYFNSGMTPASAKIFHEMKIMEENDSPSDNANFRVLSLLANAAVNPTDRQIKYIYDKWRFSEYGGRDKESIVETIAAKQKYYEELGAQVLVRSAPLIIVVITPIMRRMFLEDFSNEIVFIDSTGSCDQSSTSVTFVFTANKIGAMPLACVLHTEQSEANYTLAFSAVKEALESNNGKKFEPKIIMTDDSSAERNALKAVFPSARLLLCIFHVCQAFWRWLWQRGHKVEKNDRQIVMQLFRDILFSTTPEEAEENASKLFSSEKVISNICVEEYTRNMWKRKLEWCLAYRKDIITRGNHTNNYMEASIRIFKDVVLQRCKAFNACALVEFISHILENYYKRRLLEFANSRRTKLQIDYRNFCNRAKNIKNIYKVQENIFHVASETENFFYTVYTDIACCDCPYGASGRFCKHLCAIEIRCGVFFKNSPLLQETDRALLAKIAVGKDAPSHFYSDMSCTSQLNSFAMTDTLGDFYADMTSSVIREDEDKTAAGTSMDRSIGYNPESCTIINLSDNITVHKESVMTLREQFSRIADIFENVNSPEVTSQIIKFNRVLAKIDSVNQATALISEKALARNSRKIKVQPTSLARRTDRGLPKSGRRIQAGRPSNLETKQRKKKREHCLVKSISLAKPNAKLH